MLWKDGSMLALLAVHMVVFGDAFADAATNILTEVTSVGKIVCTIGLILAAAAKATGLSHDNRALAGCAFGAVMCYTPSVLTSLLGV